MTQQEFAATYHMKHLRVHYPDSDSFEGLCTAALLETTEGCPILGILARPGEWRTYALDADLSELQYFTVVG